METPAYCTPPPCPEPPVRRAESPRKGTHVLMSGITAEIYPYPEDLSYQPVELGLQVFGAAAHTLTRKIQGGDRQILSRSTENRDITCSITFNSLGLGEEDQLLLVNEDEFISVTIRKGKSPEQCKMVYESRLSRALKNWEKAPSEEKSNYWEKVQEAQMELVVVKRGDK